MTQRHDHLGPWIYGRVRGGRALRPWVYVRVYDVSGETAFEHIMVMAATEEEAYDAGNDALPFPPGWVALNDYVIDVRDIESGVMAVCRKAVEEQRRRGAS